MRTRAARIQINANEPAMLMVLELSASRWKVVFADRLSGKRRRIGMDAWDQERVRMEVGKAKQRFGLAADTRVICCQEAGRDGFSVHRLLLSMGIESLVIDAGSVEVSRKQRRAKTDRLDAEKLMDHLCRYIGGEPRVWRVLHVPSELAEDRRRLNRAMEVLKGERKRMCCRIHSTLATIGLRCRLTSKWGEQIEQLRQWNGQPLAPMLLVTLRLEWRRLEQVQEALAELEGERRRLIQSGEGRDLQMIRSLQKLGAIGEEGAWLLVLECFGYRRFDNQRQVAACAGLTPTPYASGASHSEQGIGKDGNKRVRWMMIQLAWGWLRRQPQSALSQWYLNRFAKAGDRPRRIGIVAVARKLLIALWRYLEHQTVPEGALLKCAA